MEAVSGGPMKAIGVIVSAFFLAAGLARPAAAATWTAGGLTFSDELGGFRLVSVSGSGTILDPIVVVEEITGQGPVVMVIRHPRGLPAEGRADAGWSMLSIAMIKIVFNRTGLNWAGFDVELRELLDLPSPYGDGLSFDQTRSFGAPLGSDSFTVGESEDEPHDRVRFHGGNVRPGTSVRFNLYITDPSVAAEFYLLQHPHPRAPIAHNTF